LGIRINRMARIGAGVARISRLQVRALALVALQASLFVMLLLAAGPLAPAWSQPKKEEVRNRLVSSEEALRQKKALEKGLAGDVDQIQAEREQLGRSLVETARRIQIAEGQLTSIEGRLGELEAQEKLLRGSLSERHGSISRLLGAMQRMGRDPPPVMITRREDALVMVRSAMMLAAAFPQLRTQALALAARLEDLGRVMGDIRSEGDKLRTETQRLTEARTQLSQLMELRRQSLEERRDALDRVRREAAEISRNVTDLNELIERLDKVVARQMIETVPAPSPSPPGEAPGGAVVASVPPAVVSPVPPPAGQMAGPRPDASPAVQPPPVAVVMQPTGPRASGRIKPAVPFAQARGLLPLPVQGKRIIGFGDKAHTNRSSGMVIETRSGAQVVSPADGWIVFAGVFRSYGQILIINGGDGYHMLLAGLSQVDVQLGQFVLAGEPVGLMSGAPRDGKSTSTANAPVLYVELRKDGRSIDPDPWWAKEGTQKVQG